MIRLVGTRTIFLFPSDVFDACYQKPSCSFFPTFLLFYFQVSLLSFLVCLFFFFPFLVVSFHIFFSVFCRFFLIYSLIYERLLFFCCSLSSFFLFPCYCFALRLIILSFIFFLLGFFLFLSFSYMYSFMKMIFLHLLLSSSLPFVSSHFLYHFLLFSYSRLGSLVSSFLYFYIYSPFFIPLSSCPSFLSLLFSPYPFLLSVLLAFLAPLVPSVPVCTFYTPCLVKLTSRSAVRTVPLATLHSVTSQPRLTICLTSLEDLPASLFLHFSLSRSPSSLHHFQETWFGRGVALE